MIVAKFGGSSVAEKQNAENIKKIIQSNPNIKFVVVSAIGKSEKYSQKVTDLLYNLYHLYKAGEDYMHVLEDIINRYANLASDLNVSVNFDKEKQKILNRLKSKNASKAYIVSRGEYLSAILYAKFLQGQFLDASEYIIFKSNNEINFYQTGKRLNALQKNKLYVIGGFYGASINALIKVFSRGGSDITGAVIAKVLNAEIYQNYTDVDGVFDKNPRIFSGASALPILSYKTAYGMADAGNEVVHKTALRLLKNSSTVLIVKNTNSNEFGTVVTSADYILSNMFVCKINIKVFKFLTLTQEQKLKLYSIGSLKQIIRHGVFYYAVYDQVYISEKQILDIPNIIDFFDCAMFTFFQNIKISVKNLKKIKKMIKKLKKCSIFSKFLAHQNNFVVLAKKDEQDKILCIANKYLQE